MRVPASSGTLLVRLFGAAILTLASFLQAGADDGPLLKRFQAEAPAGWARIADRCSKLVVIGSNTDRRAGNSLQVDAPKFTLRIKDLYCLRISGARLSYEFGPISLDLAPPKRDPGYSYIYGLNEDYSFGLERAERGANYRVDGVTFGPGPTDDARRNLEFEKALFVSPLAGRFYHDDAAEMMKRGGFRVMKIDQVASGDRQLVQIEFTYDEPGKVGVRPHSGRLLLDPDCHWAVKEAEITITRDGKTLMRPYGWTIDYERDKDGFPEVKRVVEYRNGPYGTIDQHILDVKKWSYEDTDAKQFRVSAFGVAEPERPAPPPR